MFHIGFLLLVYQNYVFNGDYPGLTMPCPGHEVSRVRVEQGTAPEFPTSISCAETQEHSNTLNSHHFNFLQRNDKHVLIDRVPQGRRSFRVQTCSKFQGLPTTEIPA